MASKFPRRVTFSTSIGVCVGYLEVLYVDNSTNATNPTLPCPLRGRVGWTKNNLSSLVSHKNIKKENQSFLTSKTT